MLGTTIAVAEGLTRGEETLMEGVELDLVCLKCMGRGLLTMVIDCTVSAGEGLRILARSRLLVSIEAFSIGTESASGVETVVWTVWKEVCR